VYEFAAAVAADAILRVWLYANDPQAGGAMGVPNVYVLEIVRR
jgi:hypothetical protein